ncbi:neutral/alkaline non-lysosomal ceramidase N-terminal domain-containing protein [bacterium]|nr:neutral/alkaline non-lysosomal ceramidase N-terminal domain-containing protein [bacterium]
MKFGFGKVDITPRVGVELCGFGAYINRKSIGVRDRLYARAFAASDGKTTVVVVSADLVAFVLETTRRVRELVRAETGLPDDGIMLHGTHTHSGPNTDPDLVGWGRLDEPYMEILPGRVAAACIQAVRNLQEATLSHAEVPCEGVGLNREYDKDAPPLEEVLREDWRPALPERTDTTCHVLNVEANGSVLGFLSYFGCHPVVCCAETRYFHGDYAGVATNLLEREHPGAIGLFLQGAQGDVNSCVVHKPEQESLLALDVIAGRYARAVRHGLQAAQPLQADVVKSARRTVTFTRTQPPVAELKKALAEKEALFVKPDAADADREVRMATVHVQALRKLIPVLEAGGTVNPATELQGLRIGPLALLGAPFEIFHEVKEEARIKARSPLPLVMGLTNDLLGYAPDRTVAARGGYATQWVPIMLGRLPFARIHDELVAELVALDAALQ